MGAKLKGSEFILIGLNTNVLQIKTLLAHAEILCIPVCMWDSK